MGKGKIKLFDLRYRDGDLIAQNLTVEEARTIALTYRFKPKSVEKIITGPDKFTYIRGGGGYELNKKFVKDLRQIKVNDWSPQNNKVAEFLKKMEVSNG